MRIRSPSHYGKNAVFFITISNRWNTSTTNEIEDENIDAYFLDYPQSSVWVELPFFVVFEYNHSIHAFLFELCCLSFTNRRTFFTLFLLLMGSSCFFFCEIISESNQSIVLCFFWITVERFLFILIVLSSHKKLCLYLRLSGVLLLPYISVTISLSTTILLHIPVFLIKHSVSLSHTHSGHGGVPGQPKGGAASLTQHIIFLFENTNGHKIGPWLQF